MIKNKRLEERRKKISKDVDLFVKHSFDIVDRIHEILKEKSLEQKDIAKLLGKSESEISKWMTGAHNFTLKTLSKIEAVLGANIIKTTSKESNLENIKFIYVYDSFFKVSSSGRNNELKPIKEINIPSIYQEPSRYLS